MAVSSMRNPRTDLGPLEQAGFLEEEHLGPPEPLEQSGIPEEEPEVGSGRNPLDLVAVVVVDPVPDPD